MTAIEKQQFASLQGQHHADVEDCIEYEESHGNDNADEMINFVVQIHKILTKNKWNWNNIFGYIIVRSILDERLEQAERQILHETSHQSRRSEKRSIKNSSSSSSSSNSSLEESQEMELEINPSDALSSHEFYQKYKESVGREKFANSKVLDKHNIKWGMSWI